MNKQNKKITNFAINLDKETKKQFESCYNENFVEKASLMPDAHNGYVAPIGSVLITKNVIIPAWIGYDIGCGILTLKFKDRNLTNNVKINSKEIFNKIKKVIPMGKGKVNHIKNVSNKTKKIFFKLFEEFKKNDYDKYIYKIIKNKSISNLGSLGAGNHFIEIGTDDDNNDLWLTIHSGSRNIGHIIATKYMKIASGSDSNFEKTAILDITKTKGKEYLNVLNFLLEFALLNRLEIAYKVREILKEVLNIETLEFEIWTNKNHNHCIFEKDLGYIHRKGATPAKKGERGVIPANMRDGCFLVEGLGNKDFLYSSSHGAGRLLSRKDAKNKIKLEEFKNSMKGIISELSFEFIDEAPQVYKNIYDVMEKQKDSVKIINHIKPIINWKGN